MGSLGEKCCLKAEEATGQLEPTTLKSLKSLTGTGFVLFCFLGSLSTFLEDCRYHTANLQKKAEFLLDGSPDLKDGGFRALVKGAGVAGGEL